jgi:hypothetical protein
MTGLCADTNELHVRKPARQHSQDFLLPTGVQMRIDFVDEHDRGSG